MDPTQALPLIPAKYQAIIGAQILHAQWPANKIIATIEHWTGAIAPRLPKTPTPPPPPVVGSPVGPPAMLLILLPLLHLTACAGLPVAFYTGPAIAPIEEISTKNPTPAVAGGYQASVGFGSFELAEHTWDYFEVGALVLGGIVLPGSSPVGALQVGGEVSALNGIVGIGALATPYAANGGGFIQGGAPGTTWALLLNVQALTALFGGESTPPGLPKLHPTLPRGGL